MNIVYTTDRTFLPQTAAGITSVCENNRKAGRIWFFIFFLQVTEEEQKRLNAHVHAYAGDHRIREVIWTDLKDMNSWFDFSFDTSGWNPIVLARLLMGQLLPKDVHRVLYLDGDTIVRKSLAGLWHQDLCGAVLGACMEPTCSRKRKEMLGLSGKPYYNAGVLLADLDAWREQKTGEEIIRFYKEQGGRLFANDQDAINGCLKDRILPLSVAYNYHNTYDIYRYRLLEKNCDYPVPSRKELERIRKDPCIVHFLGEERPWREGNKHRFRDEYLYYLSLTPWKGQGMEYGWSLYFLCWRVFNRVMRPFPLLRCRIINQLIPLVLQRRKQRMK